MKRLSLPAVFFITMFFPLNIPAQNFGSVTKIHKTFPAKIILSRPDEIPAGTYTGTIMEKVSTRNINFLNIVFLLQLVIAFFILIFPLNNFPLTTKQ